jgi:phenylpropionate dioxygenase-like ring-hydroxylating dioxygenase large terminal subunit
MSIERHCYSDAGSFARELKSIFAERLFAGTHSDFAERGDYRSLSIGRKAVTVRRTRDGVSAFNNVCLHRNALIDLPGCGNRPFRCGYHGWSYADDGALAAAPLTDMSGIAACRLESYPVRESQGLYFLGFGGAAPAVDEVAQVLSETRVVPDAPFHVEVMEHACNWKLLVENVLEGYHLSFVHGSSFRPAGFTSTGRYAWHGGRYTSWSEMLPTEAADKSATFRRLTPQAGHFYRHGYVFPDLFFSNTNGLIGFLSHVVPVDAGHTRLVWRLFELPALKALAAAARKHIKDEAIGFTQNALAEDKVVVEACQRGLEADGPGVQLQPQEARIAHFHGLYLSRMANV